MNINVSAEISLPSALTGTTLNCCCFAAVQSTFPRSSQQLQPQMENLCSAYWSQMPGSGTLLASSIWLFC